MDVFISIMVYITLIREDQVSGSVDFFMHSQELIYSEAEVYCKQNNGTVIAFDSQEKWNNFTASNLFTVSLKDKNFWLGYKYQATLCDSADCFDISDVDWWCSAFPETCGDVDRCIHVHQKDVKVHRKACTDKNIVICERGAIQSETPVVEQTSPSTKTTPVITTSKSPMETSTAVTSPTSSSTDSSPVTTSKSSTEPPETSKSPTTMEIAPISTSATSTVKETTVATETTNMAMNREELIEAIRKLKIQLIVGKTNTSLYRRQFISVYESRVSSITMGSVAIVFLVFCISAIVGSDVINMIKFINRRRYKDTRNEENAACADLNID